MEVWDLYNENRQIIGEHIRGQKLPDNAYHLVVNVWIKNKDDKYLISQRSDQILSNPLLWETTCGSVLKGESSIQGALREVKEELGIDLNINDGKLVFSTLRKKINNKIYNDFLDVYLFLYNGEVSLKNATTNEVVQYKWLTVEQIKELFERKLLISSLQYFFETKDLC